MFPELGFEGLEGKVLRWFGGLEGFFCICICVRCVLGGGGGGENSARAGGGGDVRPARGVCDLEAFVIVGAGRGVFVILFGFSVGFGFFLSFGRWVLVWGWLGHFSSGSAPCVLLARPHFLFQSLSSRNFYSSFFANLLIISYYSHNSITTSSTS